MKKIYLNVENLDGTLIEGVRLLAADRIKANKIARMNDIPWEENPQCHGLLVFCALRRTGQTGADNFEDFINQVADYEITSDTQGEPAGEDPTSAGQEA